VTVLDNDPVLRATAQPVTRVDEGTRRLMDDMVETMRDAPGVGLAAPQVALSLRVIVVETPLDLDDPDAGMRLLQLANPEIAWRSDEIVEGQEACLSIPNLFGDVPRATAVRVRALDRDGKDVEMEARDFEARVLLHEIDHLDGVLFTDRVDSLDKLYTFGEDDGGDTVRVPYSIPAI
jgi:peptide deformylase